MRKNIPTLLMICAVMLSIVIAGCGPSGSSSPPNAAGASKMFGVASSGDATAGGTVIVKDSSAQVQEKTAAIDSKGTYTIDVTGFKPPFLLKAVWADQEGEKRMYSASAKGGRTNINPLSDTAVTAAADGRDREELYARRDHDEDNRTAYNFEKVIDSLRTVLAPLFALYQVSGNAVSGDDDDEGEDDGDDDADNDGNHDNAGLHEMFRDVRFAVKDGIVTVTNRQTGGVIFSGSLDDLASGTFYPENMPVAPGTGDGGTTTPPPVPCIYTYDAWGPCLSNVQTRNLLSSSPAGCTGTPILTQSCTDVPPSPTACTSFTYSDWGACQSNNTQTRTVVSSSPAGCTGGTPVLSQPCTYVPPVTACTSFTYSDWGACQSNNTQTRTVTSSSPAGCTGGTPVLSQPCTYVPPVTTCTSFTYSAWGACQPNNTQTRNLLTSSPAGCTGGTPVLSQSCTYVPPAPTCGSCHAIPPGTGQHDFHVSRGISCSSCHGTGYSSTTVNSATHQNGVINVTVSNWNPTTRTCGGCHSAGSRTW